MKLDSAFLFPEQGSAKDAEAQVNHGGVKGIHHASKLEYPDRRALSGFHHNTIGEFLKDATITVIVHFRQENQYHLFHINVYQKMTII